MERCEQGRVVWITGFSGSGKTTVARLLKTALAARGCSVVLLDGDELRDFMPTGNRFDRDSRLSLALSYSGLCRLLSEQGFTVICATISMRNEVYEWNRRNIANYIEVFLDVAPEVRAARDPKRYYARIQGGDLVEFAGHDLGVDLPSTPHLHLTPAADEAASRTMERIVAFLE